MVIKSEENTITYVFIYTCIWTHIYGLIYYYCSYLYRYLIFLYIKKIKQRIDVPVYHTHRLT